MATNMNFASLFADMQSYLERGGSLATDQTVYKQIPRLINAAERNIMVLLKLQGEIEVLTSMTGLQANNGVIPKPDRWRETVSINYGSGDTLDERTPLFPRGYGTCNMVWPNRKKVAPPEFYADYSLSHWLVVPTPDRTYPAEFINYMQPVLLDDQNSTNFFTNYTPNLLLYEALCQAEPFLKDDQRLALWKGERNEQLSALNGQDMQKILDRSAQRSRP